MIYYKKGNLLDSSAEDCPHGNNGHVTTLKGLIKKSNAN